MEAPKVEPVVADGSRPGKTTVLPPLASLDGGYVLNHDDSALLDDMQRRAVLYFIEQSDPVTGLARDRAPNNGSSATPIGSSAAAAQRCGPRT